MNKLLFGIICVLILSACNAIQKDPLHGTWRSTGNAEEHLIFGEDHDFMMGVNQQKQLEILKSESNGTVALKYETVTEVEPHQLYTVLIVGEEKSRMPVGIYKIEGDKLIIRQTTEYHRTLGGFDMGVSRYEMPKDFSGVLDVYERVK